jgi:hypothetical protein
MVVFTAPVVACRAVEAMDVAISFMYMLPMGLFAGTMVPKELNYLGSAVKSTRYKIQAVPSKTLVYNKSPE